MSAIDNTSEHQFGPRTYATPVSSGNSGSRTYIAPRAHIENDQAARRLSPEHQHLAPGSGQQILPFPTRVFTRSGDL